MTKTLKNILEGVEIIEIVGNNEILIKSIQFDSRKIGIDDLFVAVRGTQTNGHNYIGKAIELGAIAVICEEIPKGFENVTFISVKDSSKALGVIASNYYGQPSEKLKLVGVTGTNGKTTIATLLYRIFFRAGYKTGLLSTVCNYINDEAIPTKLTTPDALEINRLLSQMVDKGCEYCFMEASSHAILQNRVAGLTYAGGVFTNITHDHLDYHKTFKEYLQAKKKFFDELPKEAFALTNVDDKNGNVMLQNTKASKYSYALRSVADFKAQVLESHFDGMLLNFNDTEFWTKLIGRFNAYNLLAIYGAGVLLGMDKQEVLRLISCEKPVDGRFETIRSENDITAIVDYAHTPDALENVLKTINDIRSGTEQLISLVGAGGNRDKTKRPQMAAIVARYADKVILTSDNPRFEKPEDIINDMQKGIDDSAKTKTITIVDRKEAIKTAVMLARRGDIILIPGKGHEDYQEVNGVRHHFNDKEIVDEFLNIKS